MGNRTGLGRCKRMDDATNDAGIICRLEFTNIRGTLRFYRVRLSRKIGLAAAFAALSQVSQNRIVGAVRNEI